MDKLYHSLRELVARRLHRTPGLLRLVVVSAQWYDTVHGRDHPPTPSLRGGPPVQAEDGLIMYRAGYLPARIIIDTDGWCRIRFDAKYQGSVVRVIYGIVRGFARFYSRPTCPLSKQILEQVVPETAGIESVHWDHRC
jgi:hypothetical protein